jgi:hypothetical protein
VDDYLVGGVTMFDAQTGLSPAGEMKILILLSRVILYFLTCFDVGRRLGNWRWYRLWCPSASLLQRRVTQRLRWTHGRNFAPPLMAKANLPRLLPPLAQLRLSCGNCDM